MESVTITAAAQTALGTGRKSKEPRNTTIGLIQTHSLLGFIVLVLDGLLLTLMEPVAAIAAAQAASDGEKTINAPGQQTVELLQTQPLLGYFVLGLAALVLALIAGVIIYALCKGNAANRIVGLLFDSSSNDPNAKPSVARLQMLIWNFTVAFAFLYVLSTRKEIYAAISSILQPEVLVLLGISNTTYLLGKNTGKKPASIDVLQTELNSSRGGQPIAQGETRSEGPGVQGRQ